LCWAGVEIPYSSYHQASASISVFFTVNLFTQLSFKHMADSLLHDDLHFYTSLSWLIEEEIIFLLAMSFLLVIHWMNIYSSLRAQAKCFLIVLAFHYPFSERTIVIIALTLVFYTTV
jgi:hypothetical protein